MPQRACGATIARAVDRHRGGIVQYRGALGRKHARGRTKKSPTRVNAIVDPAFGPKADADADALMIF